MIGGVGALRVSTIAPMPLTPARLRTDLHRAGPRRLPGYAPDRGGHLILPVALALVGVGKFLVGVGIAVTRVQAVSLRETIDLSPTAGPHAGDVPAAGLRHGPPAAFSVVSWWSARPARRLRLIAIAGVAAAVPLLLSPIRTRRTLPPSSTEGPLPRRRSASPTPTRSRARPDPNDAERIAATGTYLTDRLSKGCTRPEWCLVAEDDGRLVGSVVLWTMPGNEMPIDVALLAGPLELIPT